MNGLLVTLQHSTLFKNKSLADIASLLKNTTYKIKTFTEHQTVFSPQQSANTLGIILTGKVAVQKSFPSGKVITVTTRGKFDLLADVAMFAQTNCYPGTITACQSSSIFLIHKDDLLHLFSLDPSLMFNFLSSVSNRIFALNRKIELICLTSIRSKIAHFLLTESGTHSSGLIVLPFSKKAWAEYLNVSRTSLSRELRYLANEGIIAFDKRTIMISNIPQLEALLDVP